MSILLGCPCHTLANGECTRYCHRISTGGYPCPDCPNPSLVRIAIAIREKMDKDPLITLNIKKPIILTIDSKN